MNQILRKKLKILVLLALADKEFADQEREFIEKICLRNKVEPGIIDELINDPVPIGSLGLYLMKNQWNTLPRVSC